MPNTTQTTQQQKLEQKMKQIETKEKEKIVGQKASALKIPYIDLYKFPVSQKALKLISEEEAKKNKVVCFLTTGQEYRLGAVDPKKPGVQKIIENFKKKFQGNIVVYMISQNSLDYVLQMYARLPKIIKLEKGVKITEQDLQKFQKELKNYKDLDKKIKEVSITDMVTLIIAASIQSDASDIHIEAQKENILIKFRIDGILHEITSIPIEQWSKIVSRIKLLAGLKINITDKPQDGRFTIYLADESIDVRTSTLPSTFGESIVMRLLMSSKAGVQFDKLGIGEHVYTKLEKQILRPNGMIITTGPTGSGKTTTLYSILNKVNDGKKKIITMEDPIEYKLEGITQSQVNASKDYTFAKGLKSILRQDPDVIMVGEIRDFETADTAINAALTGHLVISTVHTNSAAGAVPRFLAMDVKPFLLAPALNAVIGQRLVRKVCKNCKTEYKPDKETLDRIKKIIADIPENSSVKIDTKNLKFYTGKGCDKCIEGYKGRIGIFEIMIITKEIEQIILSEKVSEYEMLDIAIKNGMLTMVQDGILKATQGITSIEEVFRVAVEEKG